MRGIEGALAVLDEVEKGAFASEALRKIWPDVIPTERKLTATLVYVTLRRLGLWKHLLAKYCKRQTESLHPQTVAVLTAGIAGVLELEHFKPGVLVNAMVQRVKHIKDQAGESRESSLVNAVLHTVMREAPDYIQSLCESSALRDQALAYGIPGWVASEWNKEWGIKEAKHLLRLSTQQTYLSLRVSPRVDRSKWVEDYLPAKSHPSEMIASSIRIESNPYPPDLPGYRDGMITPQGESSIWAVETLLSYWNGGYLLDMCCGRGIKAAQILEARPEARLEGWDLSGTRLIAARKELTRLDVSERATLVQGDALKLNPEESPSAILLDAPCSGSGTWGRHPEGKWRSSPAKMKTASELQKQLFARAVDFLAPGGIIMYCTCSIFREENEKVVGTVLADRRDLVELPVKGRFETLKKGKPYGALMWPELPWLDGFYSALFRKKS